MQRAAQKLAAIDAELGKIIRSCGFAILVAGIAVFSNFSFGFGTFKELVLNSASIKKIILF